MLLVVNKLVIFFLMKLFMRSHTSNHPAYVYIIFPCQLHFTCLNAHDAIAYGTELLSNITDYWSLGGGGGGGGSFSEMMDPSISDIWAIT